MVKINGKKFATAKRIFCHLQKEQRMQYGLAAEISGAKVYLAGSRSERGELMVVASNQRTKNAVEIYLRRWEIETLFSCLKGRGFFFEATHLKDPERIGKMMALLTVGLCWAHKIGEWRSTKRPIRWCKHRDCIRPQNSFFRVGLDAFREILINPLRRRAKTKRYFKLLIPPKLAPGGVSGAVR